MSFTRTSADIREPFGPAVVKRGLHIQYVVESRDPITGVWSGKDISAARYTYKIRSWASDDDSSPATDLTITKGTQDTLGELDYYYPCGATVLDTQMFEIVEVDNDNADASTNSGQRERILVRWRQPIIDAP